MKVRHVAAIFKPEDPAHSSRRSRNLVPPQRKHHAADQMHHQISGDPRAVRPPAAPAREMKRIEINLGSVIEPGVPVECLWRQIEWRRILPGARRIVAAERQLNHLYIANRSAGVEFTSLFAKERTHALRSNLHDPVIFLCGL